MSWDSNEHNKTHPLALSGFPKAEADMTNNDSHGIILDFSNLTSVVTDEILEIDGRMEQSLPMPPLLKTSNLMAAIFSTAYILVFILAVVNNSLVVCVVYRNPQMRNVTNFFLTNLAVADITVSFLVLPITLLSNLFKG